MCTLKHNNLFCTADSLCWYLFIWIRIFFFSYLSYIKICPCTPSNCLSVPCGKTSVWKSKWQRVNNSTYKNEPCNTMETYRPYYSTQHSNAAILCVCADSPLRWEPQSLGCGMRRRGRSRLAEPSWVWWWWDAESLNGLHTGLTRARQQMTKMTSRKIQTETILSGS